MNKPKGYEEAKAFTEQERLPVGGYVLKIMKAENISYDWGDVLLISFDIAEGEHKGFYAENYRSQPMEDKKWKGTMRLNVPKGDESEKDGWTMRRFKTNMTAIEDSNNGFRWEWDESKLKDKLVGAMFNNKQYEMNGRTGMYTNCYGFYKAEDIRAGKVKIPADTLLKGKAAPAASNGFGSMSDYEEVTDDGDLPF